MERYKICQDSIIHDSCGFGCCVALLGPPLKTEIFPEHVPDFVRAGVRQFPASWEQPVAAEGSGTGGWKNHYRREGHREAWLGYRDKFFCVTEGLPCTHQKMAWGVDGTYPPKYPRIYT